jgi:nitrous oxidase accessory protein
VSVEGFIVTDSGADLGDQNAGIYIQPGSHRAVVPAATSATPSSACGSKRPRMYVIEDNLITGKRDWISSQRGNGIQLYNTSARDHRQQHQLRARRDLRRCLPRRLFRGNRMHHSRYGTHYMNSYHNVWEDNDTYYNRGGLALMEVRDQVVRNNRAWGNSDHGIMLRTIQDAVVENNIVAGNARGFFIYDAEYNTCAATWWSTTRSACTCGPARPATWSRSNDFIANREQVRYVALATKSGAAENGNYWSNYVGWDRNGDGHGDVPYEANDMVDRLSWRHPMVKLLLASPAIQTLRLIASSFRCCAPPASWTASRACAPNIPTGETGLASTIVEARGVTKDFGSVAGRQRCRPVHRPGRTLRPDRPQRRRQEHAVQDDARPDAPHLGRRSTWTASPSPARAFGKPGARSAICPRTSSSTTTSPGSRRCISLPT